MDEAARLRIIIQALGVREAQRGIKSVDSGLTGAAASAHKMEKAQAGLRLQTVQVEKAQAALGRVTKKYGADSIQAREAAARLGVAQQRVASTNRAVASAGQSASRQIAATTRAADHSTKSLSRLKTQAQQSGRQLSMLGRVAAVGGAAGLAVGFGAAVKAGFKFNAQMESNELAMRRFIGSTAQTKRYLKDLADLAERSPFEFTQLTQGARRMMAFGLSAKQTKSTLTAVADAIAAAGGGAERIDQVTLALGQMATKGKVSGEELLQLNEAGIPATKILKRELGLTGEQVGKIGNLGIKSGVAIKALTQGMTRDFGGASKEQAKTWDGLMSTLRDKWARASGDMTKGLFREAKKWAPRIAETLDSIGRVFRRKDLSLGEKIKLSAGVVRRNILNPIGRAVGRMNLGEKLSQAFENATPRVLNAMGTLARKGAGVFVRAWADAGPWAHFLTMAFLGHKLGVFRMFGRRAASRFSSSFETRASSNMVAGIGNVGRSKGVTGAIGSLGKSIGITLAVTAAIEFGTRFSSEISTALTAAGDWVKGAAATLGDIAGTVLPPSPFAHGNRNKPGVGAGGAGLLNPGGLGSIPKRWNNPNEGGAGMRGAVMRPGRGGKSGQSFADLRMKTRGAANSRIGARVDTIDFQLEMGRITAGVAADQLEALAGGVKHNKKLRRQILVSAHNLREQVSQDAQQESADARRDAQEQRRKAAAREKSERRRMVSERRGARAAHQREVRAAQARQRRRSGGSGDFELNVGDGVIPTVYEVRRTELGRRGRSGHAPVGIAQHSQGTTIHGGVQITIEGAGKRTKEIVNETMAAIRHHERTAGNASRRARQGKRR